MPRLYKVARHGGRYERTLGLFRRARAVAPELREVGDHPGIGRDARRARSPRCAICARSASRILTLGQYLRPSVAAPAGREVLSPRRVRRAGHRSAVSSASVMSSPDRWSAARITPSARPTSRMTGRRASDERARSRSACTRVERACRSRSRKRLHQATLGPSRPHGLRSNDLRADAHGVRDLGRSWPEPSCYLPSLIAPRRPTRVKAEPFECGKDAIEVCGRALRDQVLDGRDLLHPDRHRAAVHLAVGDAVPAARLVRLRRDARVPGHSDARVRVHMAQGGPRMGVGAFFTSEARRGHRLGQEVLDLPVSVRDGVLRDGVHGHGVLALRHRPLRRRAAALLAPPGRRPLRGRNDQPQDGARPQARSTTR